MIFLRSLIFNLCFIAWAVVSALLFVPFFIASPRLAGPPWAKFALFLVRIICGIDYEIRGREHMVKGAAIYASKHQSAWDTAIYLALLKNPAYVLKRELLSLPLWGWYLWRMQMIALNRSAAASAMKELIKQAKECTAESRPIVIFPEGTRKAPGAAPQYHPGIAALYSQLNVSVIPVALNSGLYWGKDAFIKRPGTILMEFLPPIPPGLARYEFMERLEESIESASQRLLEEGKSHL